MSITTLTGNEIKRKSKGDCQGTLIDSKTLVTAASCATYDYYDGYGRARRNADSEEKLHPPPPRPTWDAYEFTVGFKHKERLFKTIHLNRSQLVTTNESTGHTIMVKMASKTRQLPTTLVNNRMQNFMFIRKLTWRF